MIRMHTRLRLLLAAGLLLAGLPAVAQPQPDAPPPMAPSRPPLERSFHMGPHGRWWDDPQLAQKLGLSSDQQKKMDEIFLQSRLTLIDRHAALEKEETLLEPLLSADQPEESRVLSQIDRIAQARAELEKANARMLLGLRAALTPAQWKTLRSLSPPDDHRHGHLHGDLHGPEGAGGPAHGRPGGADEVPPAGDL